jgi:excisionase family DNA binding protein
LIRVDDKKDIANNCLKLKRLLTVKEAAEYLSISRSHLYTLVKSRKIRSLKFGKRRLFDSLDLDAFIEEMKSDKEIYNHY